MERLTAFGNQRAYIYLSSTNAEKHSAHFLNGIPTDAGQPRIAKLAPIII
jgi:hypothetical protein